MSIQKETHPAIFILGGDPIEIRNKEGKRVCDISEDKKKLTIRRGKSTTIAYVVKGEIKILNK